MVRWIVTITNEGAALLASVIAAQGTLNITEARVSDHNYYGQEATLTEGTFADVYQTVPASATVINSTTIKVKAMFSAAGLPIAREMATVGIIANDGNSDILLAVLTTADEPDTIEPGIGVDQGSVTFNINLTVSSTSDITVVGTTAAVLYDTDIVDNLTTADATKVLSANMGRVLNENVEAIVDVLGAKNLGIPLEDMTYLNLSASNNSDGSLTVTTNGLACGGVSANWSSPFILKKGTYQVSFGLDTDETPSLTGFAVILKVYSTSYWLCTSGDSVASRKITLAADTEVVWGLYCESGTVVATQTAYPMIRPASIVDPTFVPYAQTNLQLTNDKAERSDLATLNLTGSTNSTGSTINKDTYFYLNGSYCKAKTSIANGATFTLNTNFKVVTVGGELNEIAYKKAIIQFDVSEFDSQLGGYVAYKNIASDIENSSYIDGIFVSALDGVYNSFTCGIKGIDPSTTYLAVKTFDSSPSNAEVTVLYH